MSPVVIPAYMAVYAELTTGDAEMRDIYDYPKPIAEREICSDDPYLVEVQQLADEHGRDKVLEIAKKILLPALIVGLCLGMMHAQERIKNICKATHVGPNAVAVSCTNGADPTISPSSGRIQGYILVSCGK